jgi:hypothetical protein
MKAVPGRSGPTEDLDPTPTVIGARIVNRSIAGTPVIPAHTGEFGDDDEALVTVRRYVSLEVGGREVRLTAANARELASALRTAADELDGPLFPGLRG